LVDYQLPAATAGGAAEIPLLITAVEQLNVDGVKVMVRRLKREHVTFDIVFIKALPGLSKSPEAGAEGKFYVLRNFRKRGDGKGVGGSQEDVYETVYSINVA
jgi:hypothetical protein